jgi:hypothetical protein
LGIWDRLHADVLQLLRQADKLDPDTVIVVDCSSTSKTGRHQL